MRTKALAIALALALTPAPSMAQDFDAGVAAAQAGDYATALQEWTPLAEQGDARAQTNLGGMYYNGQGVAQWNAPSEVVHQLGYDYPVLGGLNDGWKTRKTRRYCAKASAS